MRSPSIAELPPPPQGESGWPWTLESVQLADRMPDGKAWPRISIVTPSFNQGRYIEETIRSVLLQGYPNLEYVIMDGGSTDGSVDIIRKYEPWLKFWVSEKDGGQVPAINKGFSMSTGDWLNWINSDDALALGALAAVAQIASKVEQATLISGTRLVRFDRCASQAMVMKWDRYATWYALGYPDMLQESTFISGRTWRVAGPLDIRLNYGFDTALYAKIIALEGEIVFTNHVIGIMNMHTGQKTAVPDPRKIIEADIIRKEYLPRNFVFSLLTRFSRTRLHWIAESLVRALMFPAARRKFCVCLYDLSAGDWRVERLA